jgi:hypothetical protein
MTRSFPFAIFLLTALCATAQDLEQFAKAHLPEGMEFAHPPVTGFFGPPGKHVVLLYRPRRDEGEFKGVVYLDRSDKGFDLPPMGLIPNQFAIEVKAVFFEKPAAAAAADLFILYAYHRNGSDADDGTACLVYRWQDRQFVRVPELEKKVTSLATADAVRRRLRSAPSGGSSK